MSIRPKTASIQPTTRSTTRIVPWLLAAWLVILYFSTLQTIISGGGDSYAIDSGEIQVALNTWGTIHFTGYPLYTILSSILTQALSFIGINPATAASATSLIWSLMSLAVLYHILTRLLQTRAWAAAITIVFVSVIETMWIHSVIAEVYSFSLLTILVALALILSLENEWHWRKWLWLTVVLGIAGSHHRLAGVVVPGLLLIILPQIAANVLTSWKRVVVSLCTGLLPFLTYLYLPIRAWQGADWVYGQSTTWPGFVAQFTGSEAAPFVLIAPQSWSEWFSNVQFTYAEVAGQITVPLLVVGAIGLILLCKNRPLRGIGLLLAVLGNLAFISYYPIGVTPGPAMLSAVALLAIGWAIVIDRLAGWQPIGAGVMIILTIGLAGWIFRPNLETIQTITQNASSVNTITTLKPLSTQTLAGTPTLAIPWGSAFFAASYGSLVTNELDNFKLVDHRADVVEIVEREGYILLPDYYVTQWPPGWWRERFSSVQMGMVAPGIVSISDKTLFQNVPANEQFRLDNGISIHRFENERLEANALHLTVYWKAEQKIDQDFSVAVHLLSQNPPVSPDDLIAQADSGHPVRGWYPTSTWEIGEIVREDYRLDFPADQNPNSIRIGMYRQNEQGEFINSNWFNFDLSETTSSD